MPLTDELAEVVAAYDTVVDDYAPLVEGAFETGSSNRARISGFTDLVPGDRHVVDLGCGPGHVTALLSRCGLDSVGVDLSPGMIAYARNAYPELTFHVADLCETGLSDRCFDGVIAWYSIIHTAPARLPVAFAEMARISRPGAPLAMGFQIGEGAQRLQGAYGHDVSYVVYRHSLVDVLAAASQAGFVEVSQEVIDPTPPREKHRQAFVIWVRSPAD